VDVCEWDKLRQKDGNMISFKKNLTAGLLAAVPLWVTWLVITFLLGLAINLAGPLTRWLVSIIRTSFPSAADALGSDIPQYIISVLLLLVILYCLGWLATHVVGRQFMRAIDYVLKKIPLAGKIYAGTKQVVAALQATPNQSKQVVLIEYPHPGMKTVGLVTKRLTDSSSGKPLLAVYVPTTPNPTSGFLEIVPEAHVTPTDWSVNDAIGFIMSGGSVGPQELDFSSRVTLGKREKREQQDE
jgi:uncharacterized membrane protein